MSFSLFCFSGSLFVSGVVESIAAIWPLTEVVYVEGLTRSGSGSEGPVEEKRYSKATGSTTIPKSSDSWGEGESSETSQSSCSRFRPSRCVAGTFCGRRAILCSWP